jgi:hypothetical protein
LYNYSLHIVGDAFDSSFPLQLFMNIVAFSLLILFTLVFSYGKYS